MDVKALYVEYQKAFDDLNPTSDTRRALEGVDRLVLDKYNPEILHLVAQNALYTLALYFGWLPCL